MKNAICWQQNFYVIIFIENLSQGYLNIKQRAGLDFKSRAAFRLLLNFSLYAYGFSVITAA